MLAKNGDILKNIRQYSHVNRRFLKLYLIVKVLVVVSLKCILCSAALFKGRMIQR